MKTLLALLALLAVAPMAHAQNVDSQSDSYLCYHGSATDPKTDAACQRIEAAASRPVAAVTPPATPKAGPSSAQNTSALAVTPNGPSSAEVKGQAPAAAANPTDVGESPLNGEGNADEANSEDNGETRVSIHPGWLAGLGALAIVAIAIGAFIALAIHFIPTIIAIARRKRNAVWIFVVNLLLGWTVIGWIWALVWSLMTDAP
ncbi:MAG TPA: superinfection immunity protein [Caulobacteraceae bacterium]